MNTFAYKENGITEYISLNPSTIKRANSNPYVESLLKNVPAESIKRLFELLVKDKTKEKAVVSIGNLNTYKTELGEQKFLHVFVDTKDMFEDNTTLNFLISNYELLQYDNIDARTGTIALTPAKDCIFSKGEAFNVCLLLFAGKENYKKDWITYNLAKETFLKPNHYNENLRKDILAFKRPSTAQINIGESVVSKLDSQLAQ